MLEDLDWGDRTPTYTPWFPICVGGPPKAHTCLGNALRGQLSADLLTTEQCPEGRSTYLGPALETLEACLPAGVAMV